MTKPKKILLALYIIPLSLYGIAFSINWKVAAITFLAASCAIGLNKTWEEYKN